MLDKAGSPLELQKEIYIRLDIAEAGDLWMSLVFFNHDVYCVTPACQNMAFLDDQLEKCSEAGKKSGVLDDCLIVSKVTA